MSIMSDNKLLQGENDLIKRLYVEECYTLRKVGRIVGRNHHYVKRRLQEMGIEITQKGRKRDPFSEQHNKKISAASKGRPCFWGGKHMPLESKYKNMFTHIQWDVDLAFLMKFDNIEKLKQLNKLLTRNRVSVHFDTEKYKLFIEKFYYDERFNRQFNYYALSKNNWDRPSLDHIIPLSKGGTWDLDNLQIISWFENRAKCNMCEDEFEFMIKRYFINKDGTRINRAQINPKVPYRKPQESKSKKLF